MKRLLFFWILLISTILVAGWRWVRVNSPDAPDLSNGFHVAYHPDLKEIFFVTPNSDHTSISTWSYDGKKWTFRCSQEKEEIDQQGCIWGAGNDNLYYDYGANRLLNIRNCYWYGTNPFFYEYDSNQCWKFVDQPGGSLSGRISYDTDRKVLVMNAYKIGTVLYTAEYDGDSLELFSSIPFERMDEGSFIAYDPDIKKTVFLDKEVLVTFEWDGNSWQYIDTDLPQGVFYPYRMAFFPEAGGIVCMTDNHTILYKNHRWEIIAEGLHFADPVYFPPDHALYAFKVVNDQLSIYNLIFYYHDRTFSRP